MEENKNDGLPIVDTPPTTPSNPPTLEDVEIPKPAESQTITVSDPVVDVQPNMSSDTSVITAQPVVDPATGTSQPEQMGETLGNPIPTENVVTEIPTQSVQPANSTSTTSTVFEDQPKKVKKKKGKKIISKIFNLLLWVILIGWVALVVIDYMHIQKEEQPQFCWFNQKTTEYKDGSVKECTGLGYKVINYDRSSFKAVEFGPFWIQDRTMQNK